MFPLFFIASALFEGCSLFPLSGNKFATTDEESLVVPVSGGIGCCPENDRYCAQTTEIGTWPYEGIWYSQEENGRNRFVTTANGEPVVYFCKNYYEPRPHLRASLSSRERQAIPLPGEYPKDTDCFITRSAKACVPDDGESGAVESELSIKGPRMLACPSIDGTFYTVYPQEGTSGKRFRCTKVFHPSVDYRRGLREAAVVYSTL